ncbi:hypothetical protein GQ607_005876 [Colletotrichum asianum]|uniref:Uncharacterized protein n=1 Tax=Colletotrichum asianum TaxID=702518 RepID=A0A8H3WF32_9PEZI|nr:hypothetical protein GQ607_005876 [Colletotrichum asianum]
MRQLFPGRGLQSKSGALAYQSSAIFALSWGGRDPSSSNRIAIRRITAIHVVGCHTTTHIQHTPSYTYQYTPPQLFCLGRTHFSNQ